MRHFLVFSSLTLLLGVSFLGGSFVSRADENLHLIIPAPGIPGYEPTSIYYEDLLRLALEKTSPTPDEIISFERFPIKSGGERLRLLLKQGAVDVIWSTSNIGREKQLKAVKFNLLKGINEYRLLLIRAEDKKKFNSITNLDELRQFKIGTGSHWSDTEIYKLNQLPVVTSWNYEPMFRMLAAKRFDYMARGLQEITIEYEREKHLDLAIENHLLLHYSQPIYFFVNKKNTILAKRILAGLKLAQADGSLDKLFFSTPHLHKAWDMLQQIHLQKIELQTSTTNKINSPQTLEEKTSPQKAIATSPTDKSSPQKAQ